MEKYIYIRWHLLTDLWDNKGISPQVKKSSSEPHKFSVEGACSHLLRYLFFHQRSKTKSENTMYWDDIMAMNVGMHDT